MIPNILSIAGTDCTGGAGIQADIKAISATGGYAMTVITAVVAQNTQGVQQVQMMPIELVEAQLAAVFDDVTVDAVKIGMLGNATMIRCVAAALERYKPQKVVLDPVMVSTSGARLLDADAIDAMRDILLPMVDIITPNLPEAAALLNSSEAVDRAQMLDQVQRLPTSTLLKGGHLLSNESPDLLSIRTERCKESRPHDSEISIQEKHYIQWLESPRVDTQNTHGTGCTLSAAIATYWALGMPLNEACMQAKKYLTSALQGADRLNVGKGRGPVHHFFNDY